MTTELKAVADQSLAELQETMNQLKETEAQALRRLRQCAEAQVRLTVLIERRKTELSEREEKRPL
jgi:hypothetical protein